MTFCQENIPIKIIKILKHMTHYEAERVNVYGETVKYHHWASLVPLMST